MKTRKRLGKRSGSPSFGTATSTGGDRPIRRGASSETSPSPPQSPAADLEPRKSEHAALLLKLPMEDLLQKFGSGGHKPGSGSAAALLGLVSCKLLQTVVSLTKTRKKYASVQDQLTLANQEILSTVEPALIQALKRDAVQFDKVIQARRNRDAEADPRKKRQFRDRALAELRPATEIPLGIARHCINLADKAITAFDLGFAAARGDSGVAISAAISGAYGALFIVFLNLTNFRGSAWARKIKAEAMEEQNQVQKLHSQLVQRISQLQMVSANAERADSRAENPSSANT